MLPTRSPPTRWTRRRKYLILLPHNAAIATITMMSVDQNLTYGPFNNVERRSEVPTSFGHQSGKQKRRGPINSRSYTIRTRQMAAAARILALVAASLSFTWERKTIHD
jgi:hypothetical protein